MIFIGAMPIGFQIANQKQGGGLNFKGLSEDGGRTDLSENLRASLFNDQLNLLSATSVWLDSTFNDGELWASSEGL
jgi:hypothetical protein